MPGVFEPCQGQVPEEPAEPRATIVEEDEDSPRITDEPLDEDLDVPFPVVPGTTVVGRPDPFPASPLGEGTVLTPGRTETLAENTASALTVVTQDQIEQSRQVEVTELLRNVPGLDIAQQGGPGRQTSVFMRGANSEHTKVLIDGIPANDPGAPTRAFDFSNLSIDNIQQIEVVRGPQSTLYGSDAMGGVINIITKRGEGPATARVGLQGGSFGTTRESLNVSGGDQQWNYSFGGSYRRIDGFSQTSVRLGGLEHDNFSGANYSGRLGWTPTDNFSVDYVFRVIDHDYDIDDFAADNLLTGQRTLGFLNRVQLRTAHLDGLWEQKVGFNLTDYDRHFPNSAFDSEFFGTTRVLDYQSNFLLTENNLLTAGFDYSDEDARSEFNPKTAQNLFGIFVEDRIQLFDRWFTTVGLRWDDHSTAGSANTYRVTSKYRIHQTGTALHGSIGTGFRAPALSQKIGFFGNPDLLPEEVFGWDAGIEQAFACDQVVLDVTYFENEFEDLIIFDFVTFTPQNIGSALTSGVELTSRWYVDDATTFLANYTYTFTKDRVTGLDLVRRAPHKARLSLNRRLMCDQANVNVNLLYVGPRTDFDEFFARTTLSEYYLLNVAGSYDVNDWCQVFARVDNVLDEDYEEVYGYTTPPLSFFGGVNLRL
jgi:vitamin B12 transporter